MNEAFESQASKDAEAVARGALAPDEDRALDASDEEPGLDSERPVLWEERHTGESALDQDPGDGPEVDQAIDPADL